MVERIPIRVLAYILLLTFVAFISPAVSSAATITFTGGSYFLNGNTITLSAGNIRNNSSVASGTLRLELWSFPFVFSGRFPTSGYYRLAVYPIGTLNGG